MNENKVVALLYRILKQMVMKYLDPKADLTFKKIFGNHPDRLRNLLYVLQSPSEDELIHLQQYLPSVEELEIRLYRCRTQSLRQVLGFGKC